MGGGGAVSLLGLNEGGRSAGSGAHAAVADGANASTNSVAGEWGRPNPPPPPPLPPPPPPPNGDLAAGAMRNAMILCATLGGGNVVPNCYAPSVGLAFHNRAPDGAADEGGGGGGGASSSLRKERAKGLTHVERWEHNFDLLATFCEREGHCELPYRHEEGGEKLGKWLSNQKHVHGKGTLDAARRLRLEALGVKFKAVELAWERNFGLLLAFRAREGHCDVPPRHEELGEKLGGWLGWQRTARGKGTLDAARRARLEALGVAWDRGEATKGKSQFERFERNFELLAAFNAREGHADVPAKHLEQGMKLGKVRLM